jgi:capsular exopolysaccharide synthesis family protein
VESVRYLRALLASWWIIVIAVIAGGAGGYLVYHQATPMYRSSVRLIVAIDTPPGEAAPDPITSAALTAQVAQDLAGIATTGPAIVAAFNQSHHANAGSALSSLNVHAGASGSFVSISVTDANSTVARDVAAAFPVTLPQSLAQLSGGGSQYKLNTVSSAALATSPYSPSKYRDLGLGLAAGIVLGLALAVLRESLNATVRDSSALEELTGQVILGTVPKDMRKVSLPSVSHPRSARAEAYRQVRTTLVNQSTKPRLTFAVTSATVGEGKTSVACNVAASFSRAGFTVALIDADMRRPRVAAVFGEKPRFGLSDLLLGRVPLQEAMFTRDDGRLAVISAGNIPADPAEIIGSNGMYELIQYLAQNYTFVIIDTPPLLPVADALVVASLVDGIVMVARLGGTTGERIQRAMHALDRVNAKILGIVPNQAARGIDRDYRYPYRYAPTRKQGDREPTPRGEPRRHRAGDARDSGRRDGS